MKQILQDIYDKIANIKKVIIIKASNETPNAWDSKVGGMPYLLEDDEYPVSVDSGEPFEFLLQINCIDLVANEYFPKKGLLQFFINNDYTFDEDDKPFIIKYIKDLVLDEKKIDYDLEDDYDLDENELEEDDETLSSMMQEEVKVTFESALDHINSTTMEWNLFKEKLACLLEPYQDELDDYESLFEKDTYFEDIDFILNDEDVLEVMHSNKLLGYPDNYLDDIRLLDDKYSEYILLLQLHPDSELFSNEEEKPVCWFIHPDDLLNLKFENVICDYFEN